jgi:hypothetical protein
VLTQNPSTNGQTKLTANEKKKKSIAYKDGVLIRTSYFFEVSSAMAETNLYWNIIQNEILAYKDSMKFPTNSGPVEYEGSGVGNLKFLYLGNLDFDREGLKTFETMKKKFLTAEKEQLDFVIHAGGFSHKLDDRAAVQGDEFFTKYSEVSAKVPILVLPGSPENDS